MIVQPTTCMHRVEGPGALARVWDTPEKEFKGKDTMALAHDAARFVVYVRLGVSEITSKWRMSHEVRMDYEVDWPSIIDLSCTCT